MLKMNLNIKATLILEVTMRLINYNLIWTTIYFITWVLNTYNLYSTAIHSITAVQNERQPRNTAQIRNDQLENGMEPEMGPSHATVSATHPAFSPANKQRLLSGMMIHEIQPKNETSTRDGESELNGILCV